MIALQGSKDVKVMRTCARGELRAETVLSRAG